MNAILNYLISSFHLTSDEVSVFLSAFERIVLKKHEVFVQHGEICNKIGLIESGLMNCSLLNDGEKAVFEFAYENTFIADYYSFLTKTPSAKEIVCLEDTILYVVTRQALEELSAKFTYIERISRITNERLFLRMHEKLTSLMLDSASLRYQKLVAERRDLPQRIPQYLLASYLNVKPETLSRIRNKIAKGLS